MALPVFVAHAGVHKGREVHAAGHIHRCVVTATTLTRWLVHVMALPPELITH